MNAFIDYIMCIVMYAAKVKKAAWSYLSDFLGQIQIFWQNHLDFLFLRSGSSASKFLQKKKSEYLSLQIRYFSVIEYQPLQKYETGRYVIPIWCIFYILIYILNSNIEVCIVVGTIINIGAFELLTLSKYVRPKNYVLSHPDLAFISNKDHSYFFIW